ncbi:MAG: N-formylglutamate amidohydrolase [Pseudomonadota bacterium]
MISEPIEAYSTLPGEQDAGLLFLCDHACNALPARYGSLGLPQAELERHIGYDIGADAVTRWLADRFRAPAVFSRYSRLLIDPNRGEDDPTLIMQISDGALIPGNVPINPEERQYRLETFHRPYHDAIEREIASAAASGRLPVLISIHSFTASWRGRDRPWHIGCLWDSDYRATRRFLSVFADQDSIIVGDNEPYDGALKNDCLYRHGTCLGLAHVLIEIRQDLISDAKGAASWAERLVPALEAINADPECHELHMFGSRTGPVATRPIPDA